MKKVIACIFALIACFGVFAQERIAVFPFEDLDNVFTQNESVMFYREFSNEFTNRSAGKFNVVPRQEVEKLINTEAAFQISVFSSQAKTAEMERVLNGTQILSGVIGKVGTRLTISVSLYSYPELIQQPGGASLRIASIDELFDKIPELVQSMHNEIAKNKHVIPPTPISKTYNIGDIGPAGGIIFYNRGFVADGWQYLEAAPAGTDFTAQWGAYGQDVAGTDRAVGSGKRNTQLIIERLKQLGESYRAAQICAGMNINGFNDWFLPSLGELDLMYKNLKQKGLGNFGNSICWSSSQTIVNGAWAKRFTNGNQSDLSKFNTLTVRAIRAF